MSTGTRNKRRSEQNRQFFLEHDMDFTNRVLYLTGPVDEAMLSKAFKFFYAVASDEACTVILNTGGGDTFAGLVIYDLIISRQGHTTIRVVGEALSMGAVILQAGTRRELPAIASSCTIMARSVYLKTTAEMSVTICSLLVSTTSVSIESCSIV
jgi:ATP-dependent protease ClpP protease subunit